MHPGIGGYKLMQEPTNGEVGTKVVELQWHIGSNFKDQIERRIDWRIIKERIQCLGPSGEAMREHKRLRRNTGQKKLENLVATKSHTRGQSQTNLRWNADYSKLKNSWMKKRRCVQILGKKRTE